MHRTRSRSTAQRAGSRHYAHLSAFSVSLNQSVSRGQRIGAVGGTGFPNTPGGFGSNLHYEQRSSFGGSARAISFDRRCA